MLTYEQWFNSIVDPIKEKFRTMIFHPNEKYFIFNEDDSSWYHVNDNEWEIPYKGNPDGMYYEVSTSIFYYKSIRNIRISIEGAGKFTDQEWIKEQYPMQIDIPYPVVNFEGRTIFVQEIFDICGKEYFDDMCSFFEKQVANDLLDEQERDKSVLILQLLKTING